MPRTQWAFTVQMVVSQLPSQWWTPWRVLALCVGSCFPRPWTSQLFLSICSLFSFFFFPSPSGVQVPVVVGPCECRLGSSVRVRVYVCGLYLLPGVSLSLFSPLQCSFVSTLWLLETRIPLFRRRRCGRSAAVGLGSLFSAITSGFNLWFVPLVLPVGHWGVRGCSQVSPH